MKSFSPSRLAGPHVQTILGAFLKTGAGVTLSRERWATPDDDFLDIDFVLPEGADWQTTPHAPIVLVLHGLGGDTSATYAAHTYRALTARGIRCFGMNYRGCSGEPNRRARVFHAGATDDPRHVLWTIARRWPEVPLAAVGFSLGGHMLLKMATEPEPLPDTLRGIVTVSAPLDLDACARKLERGMGRVYARWILLHLRRFVRAKQAGGWPFTDRDRDEGRRPPDLERALAATTIRAFDDAMIAPLHGFQDAADYYARAAAGPHLASIPLPTTIVRADDDPFLDPAELDLPGLANPLIELVRTPRGGHVGFVSGIRRRSFWVEDAVADRLQELLTP